MDIFVVSKLQKVAMCCFPLTLDTVKELAGLSLVHEQGGKHSTLTANGINFGAHAR